MPENSDTTDRRRFLRLVLQNPINQALLERLPQLDLPDSHLVAGCLFQTVWNHLCGYSPTHGIADYDVFYCDPCDVTWQAEDRAIRRCEAAVADLRSEVQLRNQGRVHLWYPQKHGMPYSPLRSTRAGIDRFLNQSSCFGIRTKSDGGHEVYAPFGYSDLFRMVVRPNPRIDLPGVYYAKAARWRELWPDLTVLPWPDENGANESGA